MKVRQQVVGAAIVRHGTVLTARRTTPPAVAGRWEFPGGKVEPGETPDDALGREVAEELGCAVEVTGWLAGEVPIGDRHVLRVATARLTAGKPRPTEHDQVRWLTPEQLDVVDWLEPDRPFLAELGETLLDGEQLAGGNVGGAVRIGDTVRRGTGPWTVAVHALLAHVATAGLRAVPRVHGFDGRGREVLDFMAGEVIDVDTELLSEPRVRDLAAWTRELHEAAAGFDHPGPWRHLPLGPTDRLGHNDLAPYNVAFEGDHVAGVFDWDFAGPTTASMELAHQAWNAVPLFRDIGAEASASRVRALAEGYGTTPQAVLDKVVARVRGSADAVRAMVRDGTAGGLVAAGEPARTEEALAALIARLPAIEAALGAGDPRR